jgi:outer membrane cobalamin receptor
VSPYVTTDIWGAYDVSLGVANATLAVSVNNLWNANYAIYNGYPMPGRHYRARINLRLH